MAGFLYSYQIIGRNCGHLIDDFFYRICNYRSEDVLKELGNGRFEFHK